MHDSTERVDREFAQSGFTGFGRRHVKGVAVVRLLVAAWLVIIGSVLCAFGHWWGVFLFAAAALHIWLAYRMPRWKLQR